MMNDEIEHKTSEYFYNKEEVIAVYIFGSYARKKERPFSDLDIGILIDDRYKKSAIDQRNTYMVELARILKKDIHPVILNSAGEELMKQIFSKGKCILVNDSRKLSRFKTAMYSRIADFAYYRNQMKEGFLRKVKEGKL